MTGEHISNPTPGVGRKRGGRAKPDWSQKRAKTQAPTPYDSYDHKNMEERPAPPEAFVRFLSEVLDDEMGPVREKRGQPWRWNMHPGAGILTLPWLRHWVFRRKGARDDDGHPFRDHVIVGSWKIPSGPLSWWIAAAEATVYHGLARERFALRVAREDPSQIPRGFRIALLPPELNWMEPIGEDVQLLIAASTGAFPAFDPLTP